MGEARVLLVGEDSLARSGLAARLERARIAVAGEAEPADAVEGSLGASAANVVVWDLGRGGELMDRLAEWAAATAPVVALLADPALAPEVITAGARGALSRDASGGQLAAAIAAAMEGLVTLDRESAAAAVRSVSAAPAMDEALTAREQEVLQLLSLGLANKQIAHRLGVSDHTAKFHVNAILGKLGAQSRSEAIVRAIRLGLVAV